MSQLLKYSFNSRWFTFPLLTVVFQIGDLKGLVDKRTVGAQSLHTVNPLPQVYIQTTMFLFTSLATSNLLQVGASLYGASAFEKASVIAGKAVHYMLLFGLPWILHGPTAALIGAASYYATQVMGV